LSHKWDCKLDLVKLAEESIPFVRAAPSFIPVPLREERKNAAKAILTDDEAVATAVHRAAELLLGNQIRNWEPESIWLGLRDHGLDISVTNRDKIMAINTLLVIPAFYWEVNAFEDTCLAFNNEIVIPEALQECSPAQLSWGVYEAELLMQANDQDPEFDYEPAKYVAVSLHREGFLLAPELLVFAQRELDRLTRSNEDLIPTVKERWEKLNKDKLDTMEFVETPIDVQLAKLAAIHLYLGERATKYRGDLAKLL